MPFLLERNAKDQVKWLKAEQSKFKPLSPHRLGHNQKIMVIIYSHTKAMAT